MINLMPGIYKICIEYNGTSYYLMGFHASICGTKRHCQVIWTKRKSQALEVKSHKQVDHIIHNVLPDKNRSLIHVLHQRRKDNEQ